MSYSVVYPQDNGDVSNVSPDIIRVRRDAHCPCLDLSKLKQQQNVKQVCLSCAVCAVEGYARRAINIKTTRILSIDQQGVDYCYQCKLPSHNTVSNTAINKV